MESQGIRNFVILAHIDHGKSTLADRMLEITGTVERRKMRAQYLDQLELERERGITIKMAPVRMKWRNCILNLIDTPGHSDFSYEVSRALAAVEGGILLVDATQGIQAQTLARFDAAKNAGLRIIGVVTKIDLVKDNKLLQQTVESVAKLIGAQSSEIMLVSGRTGEGVRTLLDKITAEFPPPPRLTNFGLKRGLIFDFFYDSHKGIIAFVRMFDGMFQRGEFVEFLKTGSRGKIKEIGIFAPELQPVDKLEEGKIGYLATGIKDPDLVRIGDTILAVAAEKSRLPNKIKAMLPGYAEPSPAVFVSLYPQDATMYNDLKQALAKLRLNDSALFYEPDRSELLGRGFKCGFLGQLHFEITAERLVREFSVKTAQSFPSVAYKIEDKTITNPNKLPDNQAEIAEPMAEVKIISPSQYLGTVLALKKVFRFFNIVTDNIGDKALIKTRLPLADLINDFDDKLKSASKGMASFSYRLAGYQVNNLVKAEILVAGQLISGLTRILPREKAEKEARRMLKKLKELLPRRQFVQALQARIGRRIIARENIPALRKNVTGYLYGGDRTRKMKLWKKQQKGKAKLKKIAEKGKIDIPIYVFKELLKK